MSDTGTLRQAARFSYRPSGVRTLPEPKLPAETPGFFLSGNTSFWCFYQIVPALVA